MTESPHCRSCASHTEPLGTARDVSLFRCPRCAFITGVPIHDSEPGERYAGYHGGPPPPDPVQRYSEWLAHAEKIVGRGRLLDVGAGRGGLVRVACGRGWSAEATELSQTAVASLRKLGIPVFEGDVSEAGYPPSHFDLVASLEVLEHLPDPVGHLRELCRITRPGGLLLLTTPNFGGLSRRCLGFRWRVIASEHLGYFSTRTLTTALRAAGYRRTRVRSRSLDVLAWQTAVKSEEPRFDAHRSADLRDHVESRLSLRLAKNFANLLLTATGLGDTLLVWAER